MIAYKPKKYEIAGFELIGYRQADGFIRLGISGDGALLPNFPPEVELLGSTYTLEFVKRNRDEYPIDPEHAGYNIEWGIYV